MKHLLVIGILLISSYLSAQSANQNLQIDYVPTQGFEFHLGFDIQFEVKSDFNHFNSAEKRPLKTIAITLSETNNWKYFRERSIYHYASKSYTNSDLSPYKSNPYPLYQYFKGAYNNPYLTFNSMVFKVPVLLNNNLMGYALINAHGGAQFVLQDFWKDKNADHPWITQISQLSLGRKWEIVEGPNRTNNSLSYQKDNDAWMYDCELNYIWELLPLAQSVQQAKNQKNDALQKEKIALYQAISKKVSAQKPVYCKVYWLDKMVNDLGVISSEESEESFTSKEETKSEKKEEATATNPITDNTSKEITTTPKDLTEKTYIERLQGYEKMYAQDFSNISKDSWKLFNEFDNQIQNRFDEMFIQEQQNRAFWNSLKISPQLTPQDQIKSYNQKLKSVSDKYNKDLNNALGNAQTFMNQNAGQEGALTGALIVGGVSAMSAKSAQNDAEKRLKNELTNNFRKVQRDLLAIEEPKKLTAKKNAARALSYEAELYYLEIYNYWNCRINGIKNGFSIYSTEWINPNCKTYKKKNLVDQVPYNSDTYLEIAKRKRNSHYQFLQPYAYQFLDKALAINNKNVNAAILYYNWLSKDIIDKRKNENSITFNNIEKLNDIISFCGYPTNDISTIHHISQTKLVGEKGYYVTQKSKKVFDTTYFTFRRNFKELENKSISYLYIAINADPNKNKVKDGLMYYLASKDHSEESFQTYLTNFPNGTFTNEAKKALNYFKTINQVNDLIQNNQFYIAGKSITSLQKQFPELIKLSDFKNGKDVNYALSRFNFENSSNLKSKKKSGKIKKLKSLYKTQIDYQKYLSNQEKIKLSRRINILRNKLEGNDFSYSMGVSIFNQTKAFTRLNVDSWSIQGDNYSSNNTLDSIAYSNRQAIWNTFNLDFRFYNHLLTIYKGVYLGLEYGTSISAMRNSVKISEENTNSNLYNTIDDYNNDNNSAILGYGDVPDTLFLAAPSRIHIGLTLSKYLFIRYNRFFVLAYNEKNNWMSRSKFEGIKDRSYDLLSIRLELPFAESKRLYVEKTNSSKNNFYNQLEIGCSFVEKNGVTFDLSFKHSLIQPLNYFNYENNFEISTLNNTSNSSEVTKYTSNDMRAQFFSINLAIGIPSVINAVWKSSRKNTRLSRINLFD